MEEFNAFLAYIDTKTTHANKDLKDRIKSAIDSFTRRSLANGTMVAGAATNRTQKVSELKKYDVLYLVTIGIPHYFLVHKVTSEKVYGLVLSSKQDAHNLHDIQKDRYFTGNYITITYLAYPLTDCLERFARVYENKREADLIFRKAKSFYEGQFGFR